MVFFFLVYLYCEKSYSVLEWFSFFLKTLYNWARVTVWGSLRAKRSEAAEGGFASRRELLLSQWVNQYIRRAATRPAPARPGPAMTLFEGLYLRMQARYGAQIFRDDGNTW